MKAIAWCPALELGNGKFDESHRTFVDALGALQRAPDSQFGVRLFALIERMENDFREEEALMESTAYPHAREHREQHARVLGALHHAVPAAIAGDYAPAREAIALLPDWFLLHLSTMDTALCRALNAPARPVEQALSPRVLNLEVQT